MLRDPRILAADDKRIQRPAGPRRTCLNVSVRESFIVRVDEDEAGGILPTALGERGGLRREIPIPGAVGAHVHHALDDRALPRARAGTREGAILGEKIVLEDRDAARQGCGGNERSYPVARS